jgi:hypothetical protein
MSESVWTALAVLLGFPISLTIVLLIIIAFSSLGEFLFSNREPLPKKSSENLTVSLTQNPPENLIEKLADSPHADS